MPAEQLVVFAGRHIPEKRAPAVVPAIARARERLPELRAEIFGDGPDRDEVLRLIEAEGLDGAVAAPGFAPSEKVSATVRARSACQLFPSAREGYGLVVVEAAAVGTPTIVVDGPDNAARRARDGRRERRRRAFGGARRTGAGDCARERRGAGAARFDRRVVPPQPAAAVDRELARAYSTTSIGGETLHVGLNVLHLVPGETGGGETVRPAPCAGAAEPGPAPHAVRGRRGISVAARRALGGVTSASFASQCKRGAEREGCSPSRRSFHAPLGEHVSTSCTTCSTPRPRCPALPQVTTIHDVIYKRFPETHAGFLNVGVALLVPLAARRSQRVLTLSEASKQDIVRFLGADPSDASTSLSTARACRSRRSP